MVSSSGLQIRTADGVNILSYNGRRIDAVMTGVSNSFGIYVNGNALKIDGVDVAFSDNDAIVKPAQDDAMFGDVDLTTDGECINITLADYNTLVGGGSVAGYKRYNKADVYHIVDDVATAAKVTYSLVDGKLVFSSGATSSMVDNVVYNSVGNTLTDNTLNLSNTVTDTNPPCISVKPFHAVVKPNESIELEYYVDTSSMELLEGLGLQKTFTVIIETASGKTVKKTTYAGYFSISTPIFESVGETWFSISVIDSNGVGSAVKFYDVLVKATVAENFYQMQDSDLETYGIAVDNDDIETAKANKAALSDFFAAVKDGGYNGVKLIKATYWIDYHGNDIVFPNGFTIDLNGATIAATQCTDLNGGHIINLNNNIDTHIINGCINGNYDGFDFDAAKTNTGKATPGEHLAVTAISNGSKYCSFEFLEISNAVGYECPIDGGYGRASEFRPESVFSDNTAVDLATGEVIPLDGMVASTPLQINGYNELTIGRAGYGGYSYMGNRRELFFSFYDANSVYLGTKKSKQYSLCKIPVNASYVRVTGYGAKSLWKYASTDGEFLIFKNPNIVKNVELVQCYWHDTRTTAIVPFKVKGARYINCKYHNIAKEQTYSVTPILGDFEDGRNWTELIEIGDCSCSGQYSHKITIYCCRGFYFHGNMDISLNNNIVEDGFVEGNNCEMVEIGLKYMCARPFMVYRNNIIGTLSITHNSGKGSYYNIDDISDVVVMSDTTIRNYCAYQSLRLKNSTNGNNKVI